MTSVDSAKRAERAIGIAMVSFGLTAFAGAMVSEGLGISISIVLGLALVWMAMAGVPGKLVALLEGSAIGAVIPSLALLAPLAAFILLAFYPATFGIALSIGADLPLDIWIVMGISALAAIVNLGFFISNTVAVIRSRGEAKHSGR